MISDIENEEMFKEEAENQFNYTTRLSDRTQ